MTLSIEVLPAPLGPIMARISPPAIAKDTSVNALMPPNERETFSTERRALATPSPLVGEGWGGGSRGCGPTVPQSPTPTPDPSPQGGGEEKPARAVYDCPSCGVGKDVSTC